MHVAGEDPCLKSVGRLVHGRQSFGKLLIWSNRNQRCKHLLILIDHCMSDCTAVITVGMVSSLPDEIFDPLFKPRPLSLWLRRGESVGTVGHTVGDVTMRDGTLMEDNAIEAVVGGPSATTSAVTFRIPDPGRELSAVRLYQEIHRPRNGPEFDYDDASGTWTLDFPLSGADRMEYLVELERADGTTESGADPHSELRAPGAFGDKSVIVMPGYEPPAWVEEPQENHGTLREIEVRCRAVRGHLPCLLWSPPDTDPEEPLPLLVANDGPEYANYSSLTHFFDVMVLGGRLPRFRAALLSPVERDEIYSASANYARSLVGEMMPELLRIAPTPPGRDRRIGMGASLGALSMLHAHRRSPATFGGLYLQSGSYFRTRYDKQESGFPRFRRISRFVGEVLMGDEWAFPIPVTMTCGLIEENLRNNRAVRDALGRQGYDVSLVENRDGHNWIGWRDTFDPHLVALIERMWT